MGQTEDDRRFEDSPTAWFCVLETALERGDLVRAGEAQQQLKRLGFRVTVTRQGRRRQTASRPKGARHD